ncbi:tetratricopeptide repeat protein [Actinomadura algeriensis]|uniref:Tetratricopeptide (TPR) repeat protein n=1 Tax=Actinomadura algeriensis TaxID=1679523 RepID=A0ABR9JSS9_9ACTN|nr:tetratricopeptide repeat protein [Actinomadura algeriensis]MBE1533631.1 tetratricopeptide (TPR) repeat protein [Actinomadura algeriensis]
MSVEDVFELMRRAEELPYGEARTVLVEDALRRADAAGDEELAFRVRLRLTNAYHYGAEPAKAFATFSRTLADHDRDPGRFGETHTLLWQMKAVVNSLTKFPEIPLDRTYAVLDDMERRYRAGGHSPQAVYHYRCAVARHVGDDSALDWFAKWRAAERDELSDCAGCDPTGMMYQLIDAGRFDEALEVAAPVLDAELTCSEQPQGVQTALMQVYLRTGRYAEAADMHRRAYRVNRTQLADLADIGEHLEFCGLTGNEARGLEILERHLGWLDRAPNPHSAMRFAASAALVLGRAAAAGHGTATLRRPAAGERAAADVPVDGLRAELATFARDLAARFDERNGTSRQGEKVRAIIDAEPVAGFVPLAAHHRRPAPAPAPAAPEPEAVGDVDTIDDLDELLDITDRRRSVRDMDRTIAAWRRFDVLAEKIEPTPLQAARRLDGRGVERAIEGDAPGAMADWAEAARRFADLDERDRRHRTLSRLGEVRVDTGDPEGMADLTAAVDHFAAHPSEDGYLVSALLRLAGGHLELDRPADALAVLDRIAPGDDPFRAPDADFLRARALVLTGEVGAGTAVLRRSLDAARAQDEPQKIAAAGLMLAQILGRIAEDQDAVPPEEIVVLLDEVLAVPSVAGPMRAAAHGERGRALLAADRPADAVADLVEGVAAWTAEGLHEAAVHLRVDLAAAYMGAGRHLEAAEVAEEALPGVIGEDGDPIAERRCRLMIAHAQKELGEPGAADAFMAMAGLAAQDGNEEARAHFLDESGDVLTNLDKDALAAERFAEAAEAYGRAGNPHGRVNALRRAAMCRMWSDDADAAESGLGEARAALADLPAEDEPARIWHTALISFDEARVLARLGRLPEAEASASAAVDAFRSLDEDDAAQTAEGLLAQLRSAVGEHPDDGSTAP